MSDQNITYTTVRFHKSSGLQNGVRPREAGYRKCSVSWKLIVIPLGIFCSLLLVTVAVLVIHIFQEKHEQENILNTLHQENQALKSNISLKEDISRNKSTEIDNLRGQLDSLNRQLNRCHKESKIILGCSQPTGKCVEGHCFCYGIKCYYLVKDDKSWSGCSQTCQDCSLSLLKIDDDVELNLLKLIFYQKKYWIGLRRNRYEGKWKWIGGGSSNLDLVKMPSLHVTGECAHLSSTGIEGADCGRKHGCVCQKRLDKFQGGSSDYDYKHEPVAYKMGILSGAEMCSSCFLSVSISSQHTISSFHFGQEEGQNFKSWSIIRKQCSSVYHLGSVRGFRTVKNNLSFVIGSLTEYHRLAGVQNLLIIQTNEVDYDDVYTCMLWLSVDDALNLGMNFLPLLMSLGVFSLLTSHCSGSRDPLLTSDDGDLSVADIQSFEVRLAAYDAVFQYHLEKHKLQETLRNLRYNYSNVQNDCNVKEEKLRNKSRECDDLKDELDSLKRERNRCYGNTKTVLDFSQYRGKCAEGRWFCCGLKCYYITMENKHWNGCKQTCQDCSLSLLKIDDDSEMRFLQLQIYPDNYWIGFSYDSTKNKWKWIDNGQSKLLNSGCPVWWWYTPPTDPCYWRPKIIFYGFQENEYLLLFLSDLTVVKSLRKRRGSAFFSFTDTYSDDCGKAHSCVFDKTIDKFPGSVCSVQESALNNPSYHRKIGGCVFLSKTRLEVEQCGRSYPCICEKRLDKFHDSLSKNT
ncbi:uncharacterized protein LOC110564294 [Meriones unguiculatus]|uniref:uncharacterized protein LOC110564294 n=1 Tax=Meriones unguiculatus TaxID=10047 RepID=UPI00293E34B9|nr:uncharacterized protein LOC110564294 [Meriones unguiculatus]